MTPTKQEMIDEIDRLKTLIDMLKSDVDCFGPSGNDIARLKNYKKELEELELLVNA